MPSLMQKPMSVSCGSKTQNVLESVQHKCQKLESVAGLFRNAGNTYKLISSWQSSAEAYVKAAETILQSEHETESVDKHNTTAAKYYCDAGDAFLHCNLNEAVVAYLRAIKLFNILGEYASSAERFKEIGEIYESDRNTDDALAAYAQAAEFYYKGNKHMSSAQMMLKVATFASEKGDVVQAASVFEKIGQQYYAAEGEEGGGLESKSIFYQCLLCHLASGDYETATNKLDDLLDSGRFECDSFECDFLERLLKACLDSSLDDFSDACYDYDMHTPLTQWETNMLLRIKCNMCELGRVHAAEHQHHSEEEQEQHDEQQQQEQHHEKKTNDEKQNNVSRNSEKYAREEKAAADTKL